MQRDLVFFCCTVLLLRVPFGKGVGPIHTPGRRHPSHHRMRKTLHPSLSCRWLALLFAHETAATSQDNLALLAGRVSAFPWLGSIAWAGGRPPTPSHPPLLASSIPRRLSTEREREDVPLALGHATVTTHELPTSSIRCYPPSPSCLLPASLPPLLLVLLPVVFYNTRWSIQHTFAKHWFDIIVQPTFVFDLSLFRTFAKVKQKDI